MDYFWSVPWLKGAVGLTRGIPGIVAHWTKDLVCDFANQGYMNWFGLELAQVLGAHLQDILGEERFKVIEPFMRAALRGEPQYVERTMVSRTGALVDMWVQYIPDRVEDRVEGVFVIASDVTLIKNTERALQASLREKNALLKEVHHRVKNNLQVITSLLRLEAGRNAQPETKAVLNDMKDRIRSMAVLHEILYRSGTFAAVDLGAYLQQLTNQAYRALVTTPGAIQLHLNLASASLGMDQAVCCGLLVNELLSNCLKHAFPAGRAGEIRVELQPVNGGPQLRLCVSDTGVGLPEDFDVRRTQSLGLQLVSDLALQLRSQLEISPGDGATFTVLFTPELPPPVEA